MTNTNQDEFGSGRSVTEKLQAEVLEQNDNTYFVQYGGNDADIEPKTPLNRMIFEADESAQDHLYDLLVYGEPITIQWTTSNRDGGLLSDYIASETTHEVSLHAQDGGTYFEIEEDGETTPVPSDFNSDVIELVTQFGNDDEVLGNKFRSLRNQIEEDYVRRDVVNEFVDRFPDDRVRIARNGWIVDEAFIVQYDAENHHVDEPRTWDAGSGDTLDVDESKPAVDLSFRVSGTGVVEAPSGETYELDETERRFLATVEVLLHPEEYLGYDQAGRVIEQRQVEEDETTDDDLISATASTANEKGFTESSGGYHSHSREKHTLTAKFSVTDEVLDRLHYQQNGHAGVNELARREREFRRADFDVFHDVPNDDDSRWQQIKRKASNATISDQVRRNLDSMFGSV